jgi:hypothetical protein
MKAGSTQLVGLPITQYKIISTLLNQFIIQIIPELIRAPETRKNGSEKIIATINQPDFILASQKLCTTFPRLCCMAYTYLQTVGKHLCGFTHVVQSSLQTRMCGFVWSVQLYGLSCVICLLPYATYYCSFSLMHLSLLPNVEFEVLLDFRYSHACE